MPEAMIIYRLHFEKNGQVYDWWNEFNSLSEEKSAQLECFKVLQNRTTQ